MRILIIGGTGNISTSISHQLLEQGVGLCRSAVIEQRSYAFPELFRVLPCWFARVGFVPGS